MRSMILVALATGSAFALIMFGRQAVAATGDYHYDFVDPDTYATCSCVCVPVATCPAQAFNSGSTSGVVFDNGTFQAYNPSAWNGEPYKYVNPFVASNIVVPAFGNTISDNTEAFCGVLESYTNPTTGVATSGVLNCSGNATLVASVPTGAEPYKQPAMGPTGKAAVLNNVGKVVTFWNGASGTFATGAPTATDFTDVTVGYAAACAVGRTGAGVSCWGADTEGLSTNSSIPTTGTYIAAAVGRYVAAAVRDDGHVVWWRTNRSASGMITLADEFISNAPTENVKYIVLSQTGPMIGVAIYNDDSMGIWMDNTNPYSPALSQAPGYYLYGTTARHYVPQGPDGNLTFLDVQIAEYSTSPQIAAVVLETGGLDVETIHGAQPMLPYDAIRWNSNTSDDAEWITGCYTPGG